MDSKDGNLIRNGQNNHGDEGDALENNSYIFQQVVANMPTDRNAPYYKMNHKNRGVCVVFNHEHFDSIQGLKSRTGTKVDCETFVKTMKKLGFDVLDYHNLKYKDLTRYISEIAAMDHSDYDCLIIAVLSHGEMGILYAQDTPYKPDMLWTPFTADKCPTLAGKPKLFFIQACQGDKLDSGITLQSRTETDGHVSHSYRIPTHADFLIAYSTVPGFYSWRNTTRGSWFMQALCMELEQNGFTHDLLTVLTFVCQRVAIDYESNTPDNVTMHMQKQIPCITSMLTRLLRFTKTTGSENFKECSKGDTKNIFDRIFSIGKSKS